jgi:3-oxoacyl-[acyl-carrier-protein] synthase II
MGSNVRRVVVTGLGAVCSLGFDVEGIWKALLRGESGAGPIRQFDSRSFPVRIGSEVDIAALPLRDVEGLGVFLSRSMRFALFGMDSAWSDAGLDERCLDLGRAGVCIGAFTSPALEGDVPRLKQMLRGDKYNADGYLAACRTRPELLAQRDVPSVSTLLSFRRHLRGPSLTVMSACSSGTQAIGEALQLIRSGQTDLMVTGGTDSMMSVMYVAGFTLLGALTQRNDHPERASRPFDLKRDGFLIGEGAGILVLEEMEHALSRHAPIRAEVVGYGSSSDGYRFTDLHPEGLGPTRCMLAALKDAGLRPENVNYINAHGTSTPQNDRVETLAIKNAFGDFAYHVPISSTKSQVGHLLCAAGGIEAVFCVLALESQTIPPTINWQNPDPNCDLDYVPNEPRVSHLSVAISNSFGFGGQNGTLVIKRWQRSGAQ